MGKMSEIWESEVAGHRDEEMGPKDHVTQAQRLPREFFCQCLVSV